MVCDIGRIWERIIARAIAYSRLEENFGPKLSNQAGQGVVEEFWTKWSHLGNGWSNEGIMPIFFLGRKKVNVKRVVYINLIVNYVFG